MKAEKSLKIVLACCLISILLNGISPGFVVAFSGESNRDSLKGIQEMAVLIETLDPDHKENALIEESLKKEMEQSLTQAGIKVNDSAPEYLYVNITTVRSKVSPIYVYSIVVSFNQYVNLEKVPSLRLYAQTWSAGTVGIVSADIMNSSIPKYVAGSVDKFIKDYLTVNPKNE